MDARAQRARTTALVLVSWVAGLLFFRWDAFRTGLSRVSAGPGDGRSDVFILEHWYQFFRGRDPWLDPPAFYPATQTLGYSDTHFLRALIYAPIRLVVDDEYLAFQLALFVVSLLGFVSFFLLSRTILKTGVTAALFGALAFTFSSALHATTPQPQFNALYFVPPLFLLFHYAWHARTRSTVRASFLATGGGLLYGLILYTTFYVGWFLTLAAGIFALVLFFLRPAATLARLKEHRSAIIKLALPAAFGALLGLIPFVYTYLPIVREGRVREWADISTTIGIPSDTVNVGKGNLVWGRLLATLPGYPVERLTQADLYRTVTPFLLVIVVVAGVMSIPKRDDESSHRLAAFAITVIVLLILPMRFGDHTLWRLVWHIPGAKAVRLVWRLQIMNTFFASCALVLLLDRMRRIHPALPLLLGAMVCVEQFSTDDWARLPRSEITRLSQTPRPPPECRAFVLVDDDPVTLNTPNTYALMLAHRLGIPTVNGYSSWLPNGWQVHPDPRVQPLPNDVVRDAATAWLRQNGIDRGVCVYDLGQGGWRGSCEGR